MDEAQIFKLSRGMDCCMEDVRRTRSDLKLGVQGGVPEWNYLESRGRRVVSAERVNEQTVGLTFCLKQATLNVVLMLALRERWRYDLNICVE